MRRLFLTAGFLAALPFVAQTTVGGGTIKGEMYNLPNSDPALNKTPIAGTEEIGIRVFDLESNAYLNTLTSSTVKRVAGDVYYFAGPGYEFGVPDKPGEKRRLVRVEFYRANPPAGITVLVNTETLNNVMVEKGTTRVIVIDVSVRRPLPSPPAACSRCGWCHVPHTYRCHR